MAFKFTVTDAKNIRDGALTDHDQCSILTFEPDTFIPVFDTATNTIDEVEAGTVAGCEDRSRYLVKHNNRFLVVVAVTMAA